MTVTILQGDCLETLKQIPDGTVQTCVTSPPYYGLRDYGVDGQIGLEETPEAYVAKLIAVFREVRRVLKEDGTVWLNLGDSYAGSGKGGQSDEKRSENWQPTYGNKGALYGLKPKDLIGIPWRVAFALQADGWWLRSDIIWHKPNPMPESVTDRPTKAHEYIFLLAKAQRYYYDAEAIAEESADRRAGTTQPGYNDKITNDIGAMNHNTRVGLMREREYRTTRNRRDVWTVTTKPYKGAHFATFPPDLIEPCILAGTSARGECPKCRKAWARVSEREKPPAEVYAKNGKPEDIAAISHPEIGKVGMGQKLQDWYNEHPVKQLGWRAQCDCGEEPVPQKVLDPFNGSGTTGAVSVKHGRDYIGCELNPEYIELTHKRLAEVQPCFI